MGDFDDLVVKRRQRKRVPKDLGRKVMCMTLKLVRRILKNQVGLFIGKNVPLFEFVIILLPKSVQKKIRHNFYNLNAVFFAQFDRF